MDQTLDSPVATAKGGDPDTIFGSGFESPPSFAAPFAVRVLNKCAYGPRPNDVAAFNALGANDAQRLSAWLDRQLAPDTINDASCEARIAAAGYATLGMTLPQLWATHVRGSSASGGPAAWPRRYYPAEEAYCAKLIRAVHSERQLYEVMVDFWHNHFNVQGWEFNIAPVFMHYDRDVMRGTHPASARRYALGNFRALLEEVAKAPAMLMFLDNKSSRGAQFNENFARELCELHTLGAGNYYPGNDPMQVPVGPDNRPRGYCDHDVYDAARALTGWTMRDDHWEFPNTPEYDTGEFLYHDPWHDKAGKYFLGTFFVANNPAGAMADGRRVFDLLAQHPGTARHICTKLVRRFITDDLPGYAGDVPLHPLVESAAAIWQAQWQAPDQIAQVLRHIISSDEFATAWGLKTKRPWEALMHAMRATGADFTPQVRPVSGWNSHVELTDRIAETGNGPFRWPTPDGYPDHSRKWSSVSPLSQTWRTLSRLTEMRAPGTGDTPFFVRVEQVTKAALPTASRSSNAIVDLWIDRIYGYPIDPARRQQLVDFMRQNAAPDAAIDLDSDDVGSGVPQHQGTWNGGNRSRHYSIARLRAMVALMLMCPEFYHR